MARSIIFDSESDALRVPFVDNIALEGRNTHGASRPAASAALSPLRDGTRLGLGVWIGVAGGSLRADAVPRSGVAFDDAGNVGGRVEGVAVVVAGVEGGTAVGGDGTAAALVGVASGGESGSVVPGNGVLGALKVDVLHAHVGAATGVVAVALNTTEIVVVEMGILEIVSAGAALVGAIEICMVDGSARDNIISPADTKSLVNTLDVGVGDGEVVGVLAEVDATVANALKDAFP